MTNKTDRDLARIRFELVELVIASTNDKQTESKLLGLIEELADASEERGYHTGYDIGCKDSELNCPDWSHLDEYYNE